MAVIYDFTNLKNKCFIGQKERDAPNSFFYLYASIIKAHHPGDIYHKPEIMETFHHYKHMIISLPSNVFNGMVT